MKIIAKIFESISNSILVIVLLGIISISGISAYKLSVNSEPSTKVLGISNDILPVREPDNTEYLSLYQTNNFTNATSYSSEDGYVLKYKIFDVLDQDIKDDLVKIPNNSAEVEQYKVSVKLNSLEKNYEFKIGVNDSYLKLDQSGLGEFPLTIEPGSSAILSFELIDEGLVQDFDFELDVNPL